MQAHPPSPMKRRHRDAARAHVERSFRNLLRRFVVLAAGLMIVLPSIASAEQKRVVQMRPIEPASEPAKPAPAQDEDPFDRPGFYVGVGGSYQYNVFQNRIEDVIQNELSGNVDLQNAKFSISDSGGINARVGYRVASFFALEVEYEWVDKYDVKGSTDTPVAFSGSLYSIEGHTLTANMKWIIPFWRIQPYLLLGGGVAIADVSRGSLYDNAIAGPALVAEGVDVQSGTNTHAAARAGLGIDFYLTRHIVVSTEVSAVLTTLKQPDLGNIDDLDYMAFSGGFQYRF